MHSLLNSREGRWQRILAKGAAGPNWPFMTQDFRIIEKKSVGGSSRKSSSRDDDSAAPGKNIASVFDSIDSL